MNHEVTSELRGICAQIVRQGWSEAEWASHEADDWFTTESYEGGFDATEMEFCFAYVTASSGEYLFQFPLSDAQAIAEGKITQLSCCTA